MKLKIAFFDLDGTLVNDKKAINEKDIKAIDKLRQLGIKIVIISGRFDSYVVNYANKLKHVDYIISNNGALVYNDKNETIFEDYFDISFIKHIWDYTFKNKIGITLNTKGMRYSNIYSTAKSTNNTIIHNLDQVHNNIYQVVFSSTEHDKITLLLDYLSQIPVTINYISKHYYTTEKTDSISVDINLEKTSKGIIIKKLLNALNINPKESICFGDNVNDIAMFNTCGTKVIMSNADNSLKQIADYVTLDNNHAGVAYYINKYILKEEDN